MISKVHSSIRFYLKVLKLQNLIRNIIKFLEFPFEIIDFTVFEIIPKTQF